jgi:hypothetical protein
MWDTRKGKNYQRIFNPYFVGELEQYTELHKKTVAKELEKVRTLMKTPK